MAFSDLIISFDTETLPERHGQVRTQLYLGEGDNQPLIVVLGGSEGGNAAASRYWKVQRERFLSQGYALLAIAYFGAEGVPEDLDRISLDGVHAAIVDAANNPMINRQCVALIGGSKGAELALALASFHADIKAVVGIVPGHAVFPAHTIAMNTSSFTHDNQPLPFVPVPWSAIPALLNRDLRGAWQEMLENEEAVERAAIAVERINGPVFLLSATRDEFWPSFEMSEVIAQRLKDKGFRYAFEHRVIEGDHSAPLGHMDLVEQFLSANFLPGTADGCARPMIAGG